MAKQAVYLGGSSVVERWLRVLRARWWSGLAVFVSVLAVVTAVLFLTRPVHRAEARLRVGEPPPMGGVSSIPSVFGLFRRSDPFANDLELLASRTLSEGVVIDAALNAVLVAPRGQHRDSIFTYLAANRETEKARFEIAWSPDGLVAVRETEPEDSLVGSVAAGDSIHFGGVTAAFRRWEQGMPTKVAIKTLPFRESVRLTRKRIVVERTRRNANVVEISFDHTDPGVAERVVAAVVERFLELRTGIQRRESRQTVDSLRVVAEETLGELRRVEAALEELQRRTRFVAPEEQSGSFVERYSEVSANLADAESELEAVENLLARVDSSDASKESWTELVSFPRFLRNPTIGALLGRLTELQQQRAELATRRTAENRDLRVLNDQIAYLDGTLQALVSGYRQALEEQIGGLQSQVADMDSVLASIPPLATELARRKRSVRLLSDVYLITEQRLRQEELREALTFANVQIIDPPALRDKPVWPRKKLGLAAGLLLASVFAALAMVIHERADRSVRYASEISATIGAPVLMVANRGKTGDLPIAPDEIQSIIRRAAALNQPGPHLTVVGASDEFLAHDVARALAGTGAFAYDHSKGAEHQRVRLLTVVPSAGNFSAAAAAAATGAPVVLIVELGRTHRDELDRAARLLAESGAKVAGAIAVCSRSQDVTAVWA